VLNRVALLPKNYKNTWKTTFVFRIIRHHQMDTISSSGNVLSGSVLIVEDDRDIREVMAEALSLEGFQVSTASNGKEALDILQSMPDDRLPQFILLDLMMPVMNGWEFLQAQRSHSKFNNIPVMVCSAVADREKFAGIQEIAKKPIDLDQLISLVKQHCDPALNYEQVS
jgi:CheY-like chemotaxis protein